MSSAKKRLRDQVARLSLDSQLAGIIEAGIDKVSDEVAVQRADKLQRHLDAMPAAVEAFLGPRKEVSVFVSHAWDMKSRESWEQVFAQAIEKSGRLDDALAKCRPNNIFIVGPRRSGKTTLALHLIEGMTGASKSAMVVMREPELAVASDRVAIFRTKEVAEDTNDVDRIIEDLFREAQKKNAAMLVVDPVGALVTTSNGARLMNALAKKLTELPIETIVVVDEEKGAKQFIQNMPEIVINTARLSGNKIEIRLNGPEGPLVDGSFRFVPGEGLLRV